MEVRAHYGFSLVFVALAMLVLPLVYIALTVALAWGLYLYVVEAGDLFFPRIGGTRRVYWQLAVLYVVPALVGFILLLFMLKPLFARRRIHELVVPLSHTQAPELFRLLGNLCRALGAPIPSRVDVDVSVNASAGFRAGFSSLFGNDIKLCFGLPLVAGLSSGEFAGVIAHEFGHFTQRAAMRFHFIINRINTWFARSVYERDDLDVVLEEAANDSVVTLVVCGLAQVGVGITRGILWMLMMLGHGLSASLSRQMEFHADACALKLVGTDTYMSMRRKILVLDACANQARVHLKNRVAPKLPDDWSSYIGVLAAQCSGQNQGQLLRQVSQIKSRWYDTHPSDAQRVEWAIQAAEPGVFHDSRPATALFLDFSELSQSLTGTYYLLALGRPLDPQHLFHVPRPTETLPDTSGDEQMIKSYFRGLGPVIKPLLIEAGSRPLLTSMAEGVRELAKHRAALERGDLFALRERVKALDRKILQGIQAQALLEAGLEPGILSVLPEAGGDGSVPGSLQKLRQEQAELWKEVEPYEGAARARLLIALGLLRARDFTSRNAKAESLNEEIADLLHVSGKMTSVYPLLLALREHFAALQVLDLARSQGESVALNAALAERMHYCKQLLSGIQETIGSSAYPFPHPKGRISIAEYACTKEYDPDPVKMMQKEAESHLQMLFALYSRVLGRFAAVATDVEAAIESEENNVPSVTRSRPRITIKLEKPGKPAAGSGPQDV